MSMDLVLAALAIIVPLQAGVFAYVIAIERRLTRLETIIEQLVQERRPAPSRGAQAVEARAR